MMFDDMKEVSFQYSDGIITGYNIEENLFVENKYTLYIRFLSQISYYPRRTVTDQYEAYNEYISFDCFAKNRKFIEDRVRQYTDQILRETDEEVVKRHNLDRKPKVHFTGNSVEDIYDQSGYKLIFFKKPRLELLEEMVVKK